MDENNKRFSISVPLDIFDEINKFQHENRISTQTKATAQILEIGIRALMGADRQYVIDEKKEPSNQIGQTVQEEHPLMQFFDELNPTGQETLLDYAETLTFNPKYKKRDTFSKEA